MSADTVENARIMNNLARTFAGVLAKQNEDRLAFVKIIDEIVGDLAKDVGTEDNWDTIKVALANVMMNSKGHLSNQQKYTDLLMNHLAKASAQIGLTGELIDRFAKEDGIEDKEDGQPSPDSQPKAFLVNSATGEIIELSPEDAQEFLRGVFEKKD